MIFCVEFLTRPVVFTEILTRPDLTRLDPWVDPTRGYLWDYLRMGCVYVTPLTVDK